MLRQDIALLCSAREGLKQISQLRVAQSEEQMAMTEYKNQIAAKYANMRRLRQLRLEVMAEREKQAAENYQ